MHDAHKETGMTAAVARAVRFNRYGSPDVLYVADADMPSPGQGEVVVEVRAAGINPGEALLHNGALHEMFPKRFPAPTFPSGQGNDLAGIVTAVGPRVSQFCVGDEVLGSACAGTATPPTPRCRYVNSSPSLPN
jgi:NADPH2:quinone reductase